MVKCGEVMRLRMDIPIQMIPVWREDEPASISVDINIVSTDGNQRDTIYTATFSFTEDGDLELQCYEVSNPHESTANTYPEYRENH